MIVSRESVRQAVARALVLAPGDTAAAVATVAQALALPADAVRDCLQPDEDWRCPAGERAPQRVCDGCAAACEAYGAAMVS